MLVLDRVSVIGAYDLGSSRSKQTVQAELLDSEMQPMRQTEGRPPGLDKRRRRRHRHRGLTKTKSKNIPSHSCRPCRSR